MTQGFLRCLLLLLAGPVAAQVPARDSAGTSYPAAARPWLLKLGTGLTRGFDWAAMRA